MNDRVREQIVKVMETGVADMFNPSEVCHIAWLHGWYELVDYIDSHHREPDDLDGYAEFLLERRNGEEKSHE